MITGQIVKILTQKENDWGRYEIESYGKKQLVVGVIPGVSIGMNVVLETVEENNSYGKQQKIVSVLSAENDSLAGARRFLADGYIKGIGAKKAEEILKLYGNKSVDLFDTEEGLNLLTQVKGLSMTTISKALSSYQESKKYKDIVLFLNGTGTKAQVEQIYNKYGDSAIKILKANPYRLQMDLSGFGFIRTDAIALASGIKPDSIYRIMAAAKYEIENAAASGGHCYLTIDEIKERVKKLLAPTPKCDDLSEKVIENALANWPESKEKLIKAHDPSAESLDNISKTAETRELIIGTLADALSQAVEDGDFVNADGKIYTAQMYNTEKQAAKMIAEMIQKNPVRYIDAKKIESAILSVEERKTQELTDKGINTEFKVTAEQRNAVYLALMHRISIVSGGPGRGKTAISEIIAYGSLSAGSQYEKRDIIMLAPTGRAAQRITESTGYSAMTAHRAVMEIKTGKRPPEGKLIICDETSMADIFLLNSILKYAKECNLVFVGDVNQIASVGPGKVLKDMIDCGKVPCILLEQGHRNSGTIAHNSDLINAGYKIDKYCYDKHFVYIPSSIDQLPNLLINDYIKKVGEYGIKNVMLCVAMRERGAVAVNRLNRLLQDVFTKGKEEALYGEGRKFRVGDRVMQIKNDYNFVMIRNKEETLGIFNGEKGTVIKVARDEENESYKMVVLFDDGSVGGYTKNTVVNLELAYATTLHKCQGSEAACMMMAYTFGDYMLLNRSLFYTGETRAKKEFRFYGEEKLQYGRMLSAFDIAVSKVDDQKRNTSLSEMIIDALEDM